MFDILDWHSKDYFPAVNQSTESLWTSSEPSECLWACPSTSGVSSSDIRPAESSVRLCVADCVAVSLRAPWSPAEATWWPSYFTRTRPTWTRVSPPSTKALSRLIVRPDVPPFSLTVFSLILSRRFMFGVWLSAVVDQRVPDGSSAPTTCASTRRCSVTAGTTVETEATRTTAVSLNLELRTNQNNMWRDVLSWVWLQLTMIMTVDELLSSWIS